MSLLNRPPTQPLRLRCILRWVLIKCCFFTLVVWLALPPANGNTDSGKRLSDIRIEIRKDTVRIEGTAVKNANIADGLVRLETSDLFDRVILRNLRSKQKLKFFEIRCKLPPLPKGKSRSLTDAQLKDRVYQILAATE